MQVAVCFRAMSAYFSSPVSRDAQYSSGRFSRQSMMKR